MRVITLTDAEYKHDLNSHVEPITFTSKIFSEKEPTSVALKISAKDFEYVFQDVMELSIASGFSYGIHTNHRLSAVVLSLPYTTFLTAEYNIIPKIEPMFTLFEMMKYTPTENCIYIFSIASEIGGLASYLLKHTIDEAKRAGFSYVLADCTNIKSQCLFEKHGFITKSSIAYDGFEKNGIYSFKNITCSKSIKRMVLKI